MSSSTRLVRRPGRGFALEFLFSMIAGITVSVWLSSSFLFQTHFNMASSRPNSIPQPTVIVKQKNENDPLKPFENYKPRIPGDKTPNILCVVTYNNQQTLPGVVNATWGARCDRLVFTSSRPNLDNFESVQVEKSGSKDYTWATYRSLLKNIDIKDADYMFVVEDMTYGVPDNIRYEFRGKNPGSENLFWGRELSTGVCRHEAFVLSRATIKELQSKMDSISSCGRSGAPFHDAFAKCLSAIKVVCRNALDFKGKLQIMEDPMALLGKKDVPASMLTEPECCSTLPLAFLGVGKTTGIRTGIFNYLYLYDYFVRDTAVYGREYMRPLNGIDAGVGKPQVGF